MSWLGGVFRFREAVGEDGELEVGPVPATADGGSPAAASGAGADVWKAAWFAAKRAADLVSLGDIRSACGVSRWGEGVSWGAGGLKERIIGVGVGLESRWGKIQPRLQQGESRSHSRRNLDRLKVSESGHQCEVAKV